MLAGRAVRAVKPAWHVIDGKNEVVGRLAAQVARILQGKHKPTFVPYADAGDYVVITNARHVKFTGNKETDKTYYWHTGYPGGIKETSPRDLFERHPERVLRKAVYGMLPRNSLRRTKWMTKLRVFLDEEHDHAANVEGSRRSAGAFLEATSPRSFRVEKARSVISFVDDVFPRDADLDAIDPATLPPAPDVTNEFIDRFAEAWKAEVAFWDAKGQAVPEYIYQLHNLPFPGLDKPSLTVDEVRVAVRSDLTAWRAEDAATRPAREAELRARPKSLSGGGRAPAGAAAAAGGAAGGGGKAGAATTGGAAKGGKPAAAPAPAAAKPAGKK